MHHHPRSSCTFGAAYALSALTSYGSPAEVTEVAMELCDEKAASRLINRALDAGVTFQVENIEDLNCCVDTATMKRVVSSVQGTLSDEALDTLTGCMDDEVFQTLLKKATSDQYARQRLWSWLTAQMKRPSKRW